MKKLTKILSLFFVAAVAFTLAACGAKTEAPKTNAPVQTTTKAPVVTTKAPVVTTKAPVVTTKAPVVTTAAPVVVPFESVNLVDYVYNAFKMAKTGGNEWAYIELDSPDVEKTGVLKLKVSVMGPESGQILFKVNDNNTKECYVNTNGGIATQEFDLSTFEFDASKPAVLVFTELGKAGTGQEYVVLECKFVYAEDKEVDLIKTCDLPETGNTGDIQFTRLYADAKNSEDMWECRSLNVEGDYSLVNHLKVTVTGGAGETIMFKINDTTEKSLTLDAQGKGTIDADFNLNWNSAKAAMIVFPNFMGSITGHPFLMSEITLSKAVPTDKPLEVADIVKANYNAVQITKTVADAWASVNLTIPNADYTGLSLLQVTVQGPEGGKILFKVNDQLECYVDTDGTLQKQNFDISGVTWNSEKFSICIFPEINMEPSNKPYSISYCRFVGEDKSYDLIGGADMPEDGQVGVFQIKRAYYEIKNSNDDWECRLLRMEGDLSKLNHIKATVYGTPGEVFTFKVNDQKDWKLTIGEDGKATLDADFNITWDPSKAAMVVFPNIAHAPTGNPFLVTECVLTYVEPTE